MDGVELFMIPNINLFTSEYQPYWLLLVSPLIPIGKYSIIKFQGLLILI